MFLETIRSDGLAHLSYLIGAGDRAWVIDPRRDVDAYLELARRHGARITHVFETHRHEDFVSGATELMRRCDAKVLHGAHLDFGFGDAAKEGDTFDLGHLRLRVLETPGHTPESLSLVVSDTDTADADTSDTDMADTDKAGSDAGGSPIFVFSGDALFVGDVGRTDFRPEHARADAEQLYESLFEKLLPLGDQVILLPAHGAGSVCGAGMADRELSTLGYERLHNPRLQLTRKAFADFKLQEEHLNPPYFERMERLNQAGAPVLGAPPRPAPRSVEAFAEAASNGCLMLDVRRPEAVCGAFVPGSIAIPLDLIPSYAGWLLPYDRDLGLVADRPEDLDEAVRLLVRLGYERIPCYLEGGLPAWERSGRCFDRIDARNAKSLEGWLAQDHSFTLLDVRSPTEFERVRLRDSHNIYLGTLSDRLAEIPADRPLVTFCGSGRRALVAASILKRHGFEDVEVCLGSMVACLAVGCEVIRGAD